MLDINFCFKKVPIIITEEIILQHYIFTALVNFDGYCEDRNKDKKILAFWSVNSSMECKEKCAKKEGCVAFAYEMPNDPTRQSCGLYRGGPYISGSGSAPLPNIKCYIMNPGTLFCFR